jgi:hypothetical protein
MGHAAVQHKRQRRKAALRWVQVFGAIVHQSAIGGPGTADPTYDFQQFMAAKSERPLICAPVVANRQAAGRPADGAAGCALVPRQWVFT